MFSEQYCVGAMEKCRLLLSMVFSSPHRFIFRNISRKNTAICRKKNFLTIIMFRSTNRSSISRLRYLEKSSNKNAKWTFARHGTKCVGPRNSFPSTYSFLFESTFISPFYKRENWIRSSRKVSYKIISEEENLAKYIIKRIACTSIH